MTRRILLMLLAFTAAVLVGAVVPLTLDSAAHDRASFIQATAGMVRSDALIAQARLEGKSDAPLVTLISQVRAAGDGLVILSGRCPRQVLVKDEGMPPGNWRQFACQAFPTH